MSKDRIRLGFIGCGGIALTHVRGLTALKQAGVGDNFEVVAACDAMAGNAETLAHRVHENLGMAPQVCTDWRQMLATKKLDAVDICLPHGLHHIACIDAFEAGLDVVVEKPFAVTVKQSRKIMAAQEKSGKILAVAVPHRRMPGARAVHWAVNTAKLIGDPTIFYVDYCVPRRAGAAAARPGIVRHNWRQERLMGGGGPIMDSGFHFMDSIQYLFGDVEQVYAQARVFGPNGRRIVLRGDEVRSTSENTVTAALSFKNGVVGNWSWAFTSPGKELRECVYYGTEGSIEDTAHGNQYMLFHLFMEGCELKKADGSAMSMLGLRGQHLAALSAEERNWMFPGGVTDHFAIELWDFFKAVQERGKPEVDGETALRAEALGLALYESVYSGQAVMVEDVLSGKISGYQQDLDEYWDNYKM